mmetsp:Transcript_23980/g.36284  ORF Transcript_23980/g.36284 Transcript_23980/m.36284 type:complete len:534 (+) Transcript_23980:109-1710(+)
MNLMCAFLPLLNFLLSLSTEPKFISSTRHVAIDSILEDKKRMSVFPLQRLDNNLDFQTLDGRDRSFARAMVTTVERRKGQIDKVIGMCRKKSHDKKKREDMWIDAVLRLGAAQLLFLDVPHHAAVKETIEILRSIPVKIPESKIKFANAILRRLGREGKELLSQHTEVCDNITPWLLEQLQKDWGNRKAKQISEAFMKKNPIHLTVPYDQNHSSAGSRQESLDIIKDAIGGETCVLPNGSIKVGDDMKGLVSKIPLYDEGAWWVQDASASLAAHALYNSFQPSALAETHVVDMCSAPGGKTAQLISMGFKRVTAVEVSERRSRQLKKNLERLRMTEKCTLCLKDGTDWTADDDNPVDAILLDAPCSATGTGSRRPDVLQRSSDIEDLLETQQKLAVHCIDNILQPGGILVYATCSILKAEGERQVEKLLSRAEGEKVETVPFQDTEVRGFEDCIAENGWLRILPGDLPNSVGPCDGFFVARLRRCGTVIDSNLDMNDRVPLEKKTVLELKEMLRNRGLKISGKKSDLIDRLLS